MPNSNSDQIKQRVIGDLKKRSTQGIAFYFIALVLVLYINGFHSRHPVFSQLFTLSVSGICIFRCIHLIVSKWIPESHARLNYAVFFVSVASTALIWGIFFAWCLSFEGEHSTQLLIAICTVGLSAGGVVSYLPSLRLSMIFNFCILLPAVILMALRNINMPLLLLIMTFSAYLALMGFRANREYWSALNNEILLLKQSEELKTLSRIDVLTGLYNRRHFDEHFELAWKQATRQGLSLALIICDIDHFKQVNDVHGHLAGDEFLKLTANILAEEFKRDTDLVARYGGEEFVILLTDTDVQTAHAMAERIRKRMEDMVLSYNHNRINTTLSIGIASTTPAHPAEQDALLLSADKALYRAKQDGRNRTVTYTGGSPDTPLRASEQGDG